MSARPTHYAAGASLGLAVGQVGVWAAGWSVTGALLLAATSAWAAPGADCDQRAWWRTIDRWVPDEWMGGGGALAHRGLSHWVAWPFLMLAGWLWLLAAVPVLAPAWWLGWGIAAGWSSHVCIMDMIYGKQVRTPEGAIVVRRGVPLMLWYCRVGGIWTSGGPGSAFAGFVLTCASVGQLIALMGGWDRLVLAAQANPGAIGGVAVLLGASTLLAGRKPRRKRRPVHA